MASPNVDELADKYSGANVGTPSSNKDESVDTLFDKYAAPSASTTAKPKVQAKSGLENFGAGVAQGFNDVINTGASAIGAVDKTVSKVFGGEGETRNQDFQNRLETANQNYESKYGQSDAASAGRLTGQVATTLPLTPVRGVQAINALAKAAPTISATGAKIAAPLVNRLTAAVGTGAYGGGIYGAATVAGTDKSLLQNAGEGLIIGAIAGPALAAGGAVARTLANKTKLAWSNLDISKLSSAAKMPASAVKNIVQRLEDAGFTPQSAQAELDRLGPKATLADLDASLTTEASGLASLGEKPTSILKGRYETRANSAVDETQKIIDSKLGAKPDIDAEKANIIKSARAETKADYEAAHSSTDVLDAKPIVEGIQKTLENAVGSEATKLKEAAGYLFKQVKVKTAEGGEEVVTKLKDDVSSLHKVRQGLDDMLDRLPTEGTSQKSNTYRAISKLRDQVDELLKTNEPMKAADAKFAAKMDIAKGLQTGHDAITKNITKERFAKTFDEASPEVKATIKKGMRAAIGDYMERSQQGEASAAQRLFSKKSVNQHNLRHAFGSNAEDALTALETQEAFRATERAVRAGSQTAERLAVQKRYGEQPSIGFASEAAKGMVLDIATGSPGLATVASGAKRYGGSKLIHISENRLKQLAEGSADILSRSGQQARNATDVMTRVKAVQDTNAARLKLTVHPKNRLPSALAAPAGETNTNQNK